MSTGPAWRRPMAEAKVTMTEEDGRVVELDQREMRLLMQVATAFSQAIRVQDGPEPSSPLHALLAAGMAWLDTHHRLQSLRLDGEQTQ